ncbi:acyl carrier protein [Derxia gummosa]|uniref:Acyl carrier protein n=1 Tax=Derxia gummosa DSM 723 TaxID=1121388 RepID=A0A8B6X711_9BURK|nr:acyl carrier protein [Derxia gummosa]
MDLDTIKTKIKEIIQDRLEIDPADIADPDTADLFAEDGWGIDSVDVLDLVLGLEKAFGVRLNQDEEVKRHFKSIETLAAYLLTVAKPVAA